MNKLIKEEINRIRQVMGLNLLTEAIIPTGTLKKLLADLIGTGFDDAIEAIGKALPDDKTEETLNFINSIRQTQDQTVQNFINSFDEVAAAKYKGMTSDLMDDLINGKLSDEVEEDILTKMASKSVGVDPRFVGVLPIDFANMYERIQKMKDNLRKRKVEDLRLAYGSDTDAYKDLVNSQVKIRNEIVNLPGTGPFKDEMLGKWDDYMQTFDEIINGVKSGADEAGEAAAKQSDEAGEAAAKQSDEIADEIDNMKISEQDLKPIVEQATSESSIEGPLFNYLQSKFKVLNFESWNRLPEAEQKRIITTMASKINIQYSSTLRANGWVDNLTSANNIIEKMNRGGKIDAVTIENIYKKVMSEQKPSFGILGNGLDKLVDLTLGISAREGTTFWTNPKQSNWWKFTQKWFLINALFVGIEGGIRYYKTREQPSPEDWFEWAEKRFDATGLLARLLMPLPAIPQRIASEIIQFAITAGALNYDGFRQLSEAQVFEYIGKTNVERLPVNEFPCYDKFPDLVEFSKRANYFKVNGENRGIWALDLSSGEPVQIKTPMSDDCTTPLVSGTKAATPAPAPAPTTTSGTMTKEQAKAAILAQGYTEPITFTPDSDGQTSYKFVDADDLKGTATLNNGNIIVK